MTDAAVLQVAHRHGLTGARIERTLGHVSLVVGAEEATRAVDFTDKVTLTEQVVSMACTTIAKALQA